MKRQICAWGLAILFGAALASGIPLIAVQDQDATPPNRDNHPPRQQKDPTRQAAMLAKRLKLSPDQEKQIVPILSERQQQVDTVRNDSSLSETDRREKMRSIREDGESKIKAVLTDEQKQAFDKMRQQMREHMQQRRDHAPGDGPTPQH